MAKTACTRRICDASDTAPFRLRWNDWARPKRPHLLVLLATLLSLNACQRDHGDRPMNRRQEEALVARRVSQAKYENFTSAESLFWYHRRFDDTLVRSLDHDRIMSAYCALLRDSVAKFVHAAWQSPKTTNTALLVEVARFADCFGEHRSPHAPHPGAASPGSDWIGKGLKGRVRILHEEYCAEYSHRGWKKEFCEPRETTRFDSLGYVTRIDRDGRNKYRKDSSFVHRLDAPHRMDVTLNDNGLVVFMLYDHRERTQRSLSCAPDRCTRYAYHFDSAGDRTQVIGYASGDSIFLRESFQYDGHRNLIREESVHGSNRRVVEHRNRYDARGRIVRKDSWSDGDWTGRSTVLYEYREDGLIHKETYRSPRHRETTVYRYDSTGNWTTKTTMDGHVQTISRIILYYP